MTKSKSQFAALPEQDRTLILGLCSQHSYDHVVEVLSRPRAEGGLSIKTSKAALCRFFSTQNLENSHAVLAQVAAAANVRHEQNSTALLGAICASIEARVYDSLLNGKALADMEKDFRFLKTAEHLYLVKSKFRADNPQAACASYQALVDRAARHEDIDFAPIEPHSPRDPNSPVALDPSADLSDFDRDVLETRARTQQKAVQEEQMRIALQAFRSARDQSPSKSEPTSPGPSIATAFPELKAAKSPAIPHIPPNSTSAPRTASVPHPADSASSAPEKITPAPVVRPTLKVGRNEPCPCGSRLKYKKCCLLRAHLSTPAPSNLPRSHAA